MKPHALLLSILLPLAFSDSAVSSNLIINGSFEQADNGWTVWNSPASWVSAEFDHNYNSSCSVWTPSPYPYIGTGTHCQHVGTDRVNGGLYQIVNVTPGKRYRVSGLWSGGVGGLNDDSTQTYSAWFEITIFHGNVTSESDIDQTLGSYEIIAKKEASNYPGDQNFSFAWERFEKTFTAQSDQATLVLKTGQYGYTWDAIAAFHDDIVILPAFPWPLFVPAITSGPGRQL